MAKTYNVGRLSVEMVADTVQYVQKLKAADTVTKKSQKGLRNEFKKTTKETKEVNKEVNKLNGTMKKLGEAATFVNGPMGGVASRIGSLNSLLGGAGGMVAVTGGAVLGLGALTTAALASSMAHAQSYKELKIYAGVAGVTTREMQLLSGATSTVNISTEKFGDIIKDVQDKIGDFVATGGGEFANVIDVLGDRLGYTAAELQKMSGPDALEAVAHSMEKANIPMDQQIFLMESIANDASRLLPLYANMSAELNNMQYQTEMLSREMDGDLLQTYVDLSKQTGMLQTNFKDFIADGLEPVAGWFLESAKNANFFFASLEEGSTAATYSRMADLADEIQDLEKNIKDMDSVSGKLGNALFGGGTDIKFMTDELVRLKKELKEIRDLEADKLAPKKEKETFQSQFGGQSYIKRSDQNAVDDQREAERIKRENDAAKKAKEAERKRLKAYKDFVAEKKAEQDRAIQYEKDYNAEIERIQAQFDQKKQDRYDLQAMALSDPSGGEDERLNNEFALLKLTNERELELLRQQYASKKGLESEYQAAMKASKNQYYSDVLQANQAAAMAELNLARDIGNQIGSQQAALAGAATEEEKDALRKQFLVKQAMAAANATLDYFATISAHEATAATLGVGGGAYLATQTALATTNYQKNLGGIAAVAIGGQFHSGTDNVPSEGSYLLQKGERVIQPKANKDLSEFLSKDGGSGGGALTISAPINVTGNVTDEKWFAAQLVKQRNVIASSVRKSENERPKSRRR